MCLSPALFSMLLCSLLPCRQSGVAELLECCTKEKAKVWIMREVTGYSSHLREAILCICLKCGDETNLAGLSSGWPSGSPRIWASLCPLVATLVLHADRVPRPPFACLPCGLWSQVPLPMCPILLCLPPAPLSIRSVGVNQSQAAFTGITYVMLLCPRPLTREKLVVAL